VADRESFAGWCKKALVLMQVHRDFLHYAVFINFVPGGRRDPANRRRTGHRFVSTADLVIQSRCDVHHHERQQKQLFGNIRSYRLEAGTSYSPAPHKTFFIRCDADCGQLFLYKATNKPHGGLVSSRLAQTNQPIRRVAAEILKRRPKREERNDP
jgi:hypothetical protein